MKLDGNGLIVLEQCSFPGSIGDSAAETSRMVTLQRLLGLPIQSDLALFVTDKGVLRYPTSPWRENDTSGDQVAPLIAAGDQSHQQAVINQIKANGYKTGNGNLINPGFFANMQRANGVWIQWPWDLAILGEAFILALPFAWNPNASMINPLTWLVSSSNQTAPYLNWINALAFARQKKWTLPCWLATKIVSKKKALAAVKSYYSVEPKVQWLLDLYDQAANEIWK